MELTSLADAVRDACAEMLKKYGCVAPVVVVVTGDEVLHDFPPAITYRDKVMLWAALQKIARDNKPDAIVYGDTAMYMDIPAEKFKGLTDEQRIRLCSMGTRWLAEYGYGVQQETLTVIAQSEHSFVSLQVPFTRTEQGIVWGEDQWRNVPQSKIGLESKTKFFRTGEVTQ